MFPIHWLIRAVSVTISRKAQIKQKKKKINKKRQAEVSSGCSNIMSIVHLITRSDNCEQPPAYRSCMYPGRSIIATLYNPRAARSVRYKRSRGVFNCICSRRDGPYGKVGGLNVRPEPRHELGQTWGEPPWTRV